MDYRDEFNKAIYNQLKNNTSLTDKLGSYVVSSTTYPTLFSGMAPSESELENQGYTVNDYYPYISIYAPLTPGAATQTFDASGGSKDVARSPSFQLTIYENTKHQISEIQTVMDLADDALSTEFMREGLHLNPKNPTNGVPKWEEDDGHYWTWMRWDAIILENET